MKRKTVMATLGVAGALALGAGAVPALAQSDEATPSPDATTDREQLREQHEERRAEAQREFAERLAEELGVDTDEVEQALEAVRGEMQDEHQAERLAALEDRLTQAVEDGDLSQEQADAVLEAAKSGAFPGGMRGGRGGPGGGGHGPGHWGDMGGGPGDNGSDPSAEGTSTAVFRA